MYNSLMTTQLTLSVGPQQPTAIVDLQNAPNSPCEVMVQNINNNGTTVYLGSGNFNPENYGLKLLDGMTLSLALGSSDDLWAFADDNINITVLKTSGNRR